MATRSAIGYMLPSGKVRAVYCHWDGTPGHQLPILTEHYTTLEAVKGLVRPGCMSELRSNKDWRGNTRPEQPLYYGERGDGDKPVTSSSLRAAERHWRGSDCEWLYVFADGEWQHQSLRAY